MPKSKNDKPAAKAPVKKAAPAPAKAAPAASTRAPVKRDPKVNSHHGSNHTSHTSVLTPPRQIEIKDPFLKRQKDRLLQLRDGMLDSMSGVARDTLRARAEGSEASAFGMHQADAGSDAYDRDFALSLLSQEQDALYEIDEALKRIEQGTYGICELCNKPILHARLEAIPFARFTVDCQSQLEKQRKMTRSRQPVTSLFGLTDEEGGSSEGEEEETVSESKE
jgi:RNA polymerase-binding transcription factor DksA